MLKLENVSKYYYNKGIIAVGFSKLNLDLKLGEFVVITGESGSGKSTLLNVISGLDSYEDGEMYINGKETSHYTEKDFEDYRRKYIANIFQSFNLVNSYTVYQNVELVLLLNGYKKRKIKKKVLEIIDKVGLLKFKNTKVSKLSGGQKQRVAIARAMVKDTPIIVADEPTGNLDSKSAKEVLEILQKVAKEKLVVMVTHNIEQVEGYATRIIKMHDGRIIENNEIKPVKKELKIEEGKYKNITFFNKHRLGFRNTFNIFSKFALLFGVFFFMSTALLAEYGAFKYAEDEVSNQGFANMILRDTSNSRLIIKKADKTAFCQEDFDKLKKLSNVDYLVENDLFIDSYIGIQNEDMAFSGNIFEVNLLSEDKLSRGKMPEKDNEIIIKTSKDNFYLETQIENLLGNTFDLYDSTGRKSVVKVQVVGIAYNEGSMDFNTTIYASKSILDLLRNYTNQYYSTAKFLANDRYMHFELIPTDEVPRGEAIINDNLRYDFKNYIVRGKEININISNIYFKKDLTLTISNTFTKNNIKRLTGINEYDNNFDSLFLNTEDFNTLFSEPPYQSSIYVKDVKVIDQTMDELKDLGYVSKKASDFKFNYDELGIKILKIFRTVVTIIVIIVLFFISYFIIRVILKSRNAYFTTLRMLGANARKIKEILDIELFSNFTISYAFLMGLLYLANQNIINNETLNNILAYLSIREYIILYAILALISLLISRRVSKKLFKNSAISTYNEEV